MNWLANIGLFLSLVGGVALAGFGAFLGVIIAAWDHNPTATDWVVYAGGSMFLGALPLGLSIWLSVHWIRGLTPGLWHKVAVCAVLIGLALIVRTTGPSTMFAFGAYLCFAGFAARVFAARRLARPEPSKGDRHVLS